MEMHWQGFATTPFAAFPHFHPDAGRIPQERMINGGHDLRSQERLLNGRRG
ncbi:unnamed protein product [[Actinomadura] parvosata subsp. kistnae]|nr:unnamed protein product [Actinomadura parvosata subsp. kistnae]